MLFRAVSIHAADVSATSAAFADGRGCSTESIDHVVLASQGELDVHRALRCMHDETGDETRVSSEVCSKVRKQDLYYLHPRAEPVQ